MRQIHVEVLAAIAMAMETALQKDVGQETITVVRPEITVMQLARALLHFPTAHRALDATKITNVLQETAEEAELLFVVMLATGVAIRIRTALMDIIAFQTTACRFSAVRQLSTADGILSLSLRRG